MLIIMGSMHVDPVDLAQFVSDFAALATVTRKRAGNISYDAAVGDPKSGRLIISERWVDQVALDAHIEAAETVAFIKHWSGRMRGNIRKYDGSNERDLMDQ